MELGKTKRTHQLTEAVSCRIHVRETGPSWPPSPGMQACNPRPTQPPSLPSFPLPPLPSSGPAPCPLHILSSHPRRQDPQLPRTPPSHTHTCCSYTSEMSFLWGSDFLVPNFNITHIRTHTHTQIHKRTHAHERTLGDPTRTHEPLPKRTLLFFSILNLSLFLPFSSIKVGHAPLIT